MGDRPPGPLDAMARHSSSSHRGLAERLLAEGRISKEQQEAALSLQRRAGSRIEDALIEVEAVSEQDLLKYLAALYQTRFVSTEKLARADIDRTTLDRLPKKLAERLSVVPVLFDAASNSLSVVTADPLNVDALDQVQKGAGAREVKALVARPAAVQAAAAKFYRGDPFAFSALEPKGRGDSGGLSLGSIPFATPQSSARNRPATERPLPGQFSLGGGEKKPLRPEAKRISLPNMPVPVAADEAWSTSNVYIETLNVLVTLLENTRENLRGHSAQVARLTRKMAERIGIALPEQNAIVVAAYLHDLGKMSAFHLTALNASQYESPRAAAMKSYATPTRLMSSAKLAKATVAAI